MKLSWKGSNGNLVCVTDDGAVYSIQSLVTDHVLQAISPDEKHMGDLGIFGKSFFDLDEAKARAQEIEDAR